MNIQRIFLTICLTLASVSAHSSSGASLAIQGTATAASMALFGYREYVKRGSIIQGKIGVVVTCTPLVTQLFSYFRGPKNPSTQEKATQKKNENFTACANIFITGWALHQIRKNCSEIPLFVNPQTFWAIINDQARPISGTAPVERFACMSQIAASLCILGKNWFLS